jgi:uncharacterized membrane protein
MPFLVIAFGVLLIAAGVYHFVNPAFYNPMMPKWFPRKLANTAGGIAEIVIGIAMLVPDWRGYGLYAAFGLMVVFLPLHVWDLMKPKPAIGPHWVAVVRLLIQVLLIWWLWREASNGAAI